MRDIVAIAKLFEGLHEADPNRGLRVEAIQHWSGGSFGDYWCAEFAWFCADIAFNFNPPFPRFQSVQTMYSMALAKGWMTDNPVAGDFFIYVKMVDGKERAYHIGIVTVDGGTKGIAGNTSADGTSSNGTMVAEHGIPKGPHVKYIHYPR